MAMDAKKPAQSKWTEAIELLKSIIAKSELEEMTKWGGPTYCINNKNVLGVGAFKSYAGIWFFDGVFLKDDKQVLISATEGSTKALRQWRFHSIDEIRENENDILKYVKEATENAKADVSHKPEKRPLMRSEFMEKALGEDTALAEAFEKFTTYKKNEFLEYIESAKREETKLSRMEKIKPMILSNIGLHDKYR